MWSMERGSTEEILLNISEYWILNIPMSKSAEYK